MNKLTTRPLQLWFMNHRFDPDETVFQVREMKRRGFGGFFMHWIGGGEPYMSEEWFRMLDLAVEEARRRNLEAWLYDEAWCPSMFAGGRILARRPELELQTLWRFWREVPGGRNVEIDFELMKMLSVVAIPVRNGRVDLSKAVDIANEVGTVNPDGGVPYVNRTSYYPHVSAVPHWRARFHRERRWRLKWRAPRGGKWRIYIFCARRRFEFDGSNLLDVLNPESIGEFIAETHERYRERYGKLFGKTIPGIMTDEAKFPPFPYTDALPELYHKRYGEDLIRALPAMIDPAAEQHKSVLTRYHRLVADLFRENYIRPMAEWCERNGLLLTGHMSPEECPWQEVELLGNLAGALRHFHIPGTDLIIQAIGDRKRKALNLGPRVAASVSRQQGKREVFVEVGACCRENLSLEQLKLFCDWLMINGVNLIAFHGLMYSMDGVRKFLTNQNLSVYNNLWCDFKVLNHYLTERCEIMREYRPCAEIAVLKPLHALRAATLSLNRTVIPAAEGEDDIVDPLDMERVSTDARNEIDRSLIDLCWELLTAHRDFDLIDEDSAVDWKTCGRSLRYRHASYRAIVVPKCAELSGECEDALARFLANDGLVLFEGAVPGSCRRGLFEGAVILRDNKELSREIGKHVEQEAMIRTRTPGRILSCIARNPEGRRIMMLLNMADVSSRARVVFGKSRMYLELAPHESRIIELNERVFGKQVGNSSRELSPVALGGKWKIKVKKDNHVPLFRAVNRIAVRGRPGGMYLVCDESELDQVKSCLKINGAGFEDAVSRVRPVRFHDFHNLKLELRLRLKQGANRIALKPRDGHFPTLLLAGRFAAFAAGKGWRIERERKTVDDVSRIGAGYPFVRGYIEFANTFRVRSDLKRGSMLSFPGRAGSVTAVIDGKRIGTVAWPPDTLVIPALRQGVHGISLRVVGDSIGLLRDPPCEAGIGGPVLVG